MDDKDFNKDSMDFFLPSSFKGLSKKYIMWAIYNKEIQASWKPQVGDVIVGGTGNVFVISAYHQGHEKVGGDKYFFGGGLCNRTGGCFLDETYAFVMNEDGMRYHYTDNGVEKSDDPYYSKFTDFRYVPYPHEMSSKIDKEVKLAAVKKILKNKKKIQEHLRNGGDIDDLDTEEFGFKQPI